MTNLFLHRVLRWCLPLIVLTGSFSDSFAQSGIEPADPALSATQIENDVQAAADAQHRLTQIQPATAAWFIAQALQNHPSLQAAESRVRAAQFDAAQSSYAPAPKLGVYGEEMGNDGGDGLFGAYFSQNHVTRNQRRWAMESGLRSSDMRAMEKEMLYRKIIADVRIAVCRVLIAQHRMELAKELDESNQKALANMRALFGAQEVSKSDVLQFEIQATQARTKLHVAESTARATWRQLLAICGQSQRPQEFIDGNLDELNDNLVWDELVLQFQSESPQIRRSILNRRRARADYESEIAKTKSGVQSQFGIGVDSSTNDEFAGFQIEIPFRKGKRNQNGITAAFQRLRAADSGVRETQLKLTQNLAREYEKYQSAFLTVQSYREILPNSRRSLELIEQAFTGQEVSYLRFLNAQQSLVNLTFEYLDALESFCISREKIASLLVDQDF